jgi:hypothetical protein
MNGFLWRMSARKLVYCVVLSLTSNGLQCIFSVTYLIVSIDFDTVCNVLETEILLSL